jgi:hypothetical protein
VVLLLVEVAHTVRKVSAWPRWSRILGSNLPNLSEVTGMVLVNVGTVVVLTTGHLVQS